MKKFLLGFFVLLVIALGGVWAASRSQQVFAGDCDSNAIIRCGFTSQSQFHSQYNADATHDLHAIYTHYGLSSAMINASAQNGTVTKSGDVIVNGKVVATGARSLGRQWMSGSSSLVINGHTYYERPTSVSFISSTIPAIVYTDQYGKFIAAVLYACGNPIVAAPKPVPIYQCLALSVSQVADSNVFNFKASSFVRDATFKYYTYTVKSGNTVLKTIQSTGDVSYTQDTAGSYAVEATVTVDALGQTVTSPVGGCKGAFTVQPKPVYACSAFSITPGTTENQFIFKASDTATNATFNSIVYTVKDSTGKVVSTVSQNTLNAYTYTQTTPGDYTVTTALTFTANGKNVTVVNPDCAGKFTVKVPPMYVCKALQAVQNGDRTSFVFTPTVTLQAATLKSVVYTVKDASGKVVDTITKTDLNPVNYSQQTVGKYTVSVVVTVTVDGQDKIASGDCAASFEVTPPPVTPVYECTNLTNKIVSDRTFAFTLNYAASGGATLSKVSVDYGDGVGSQDVPLTSLPTFNYTYAKDGTFNIVATLSFVINGDQTNVKSVTCSTSLTISPAMCTVPGKETLPANSPECFTPCQFNTALPFNSPQCVPPTTPPVTPTALINTGPGDIVGLFAATTIAGTVAHRLIWARRYGRQ